MSLSRRLPVFPAAVAAVAGIAAWAAAGTVHAQSKDDTTDAIRVTTALHEDGSKTVTEIHPDDHTSSASTYDATDHLRQKVVYTLNDQNQPATGIVYAPNGQPGYRTAYKYDDTLHMLEEDDFTLDGQLIRRFVYEYGAGGKVARIRAYDAEGNELTQTQARKDIQKNPPRRRR